VAGDLLHLIRGAEKKAEEIVQKATDESKEIIKQAKVSAGNLLEEVEKKKQADEHKGQSNIQDKITVHKERLMTDFRTKEETLKKRASEKEEEGINLVIKSILDV
jgi:vacuolar-type H+-ATPase subunit H